MVQMNVLAKQSRNTVTAVENKLMYHCGKRRMNWEIQMDIYTLCRNQITNENLRFKGW